MTPSLASLLWFAAVLVMIPLGLLLLKRSPWGRQLAERAHPAGRVVGSTVIGPQQRLLTLEVGEGETRRWLLLGVTGQNISHLLTSDTPLHVHAAATEPSAATASVPESFQRVLARWRPAQG